MLDWLFTIAYGSQLTQYHSRIQLNSMMLSIGWNGARILSTREHVPGDGFSSLNLSWNESGSARCEWTSLNSPSTQTLHPEKKPSEVWWTEGDGCTFQGNAAGAVAPKALMPAHHFGEELDAHDRVPCRAGTS